MKDLSKRPPKKVLDKRRGPVYSVSMIQQASNSRYSFAMRRADMDLENFNIQRRHLSQHYGKVYCRRCRLEIDALTLRIDDEAKRTQMCTTCHSIAKLPKPTPERSY